MAPYHNGMCFKIEKYVTPEQNVMHGNKKETGCYAISFSKNNTYQKPRSYSIQYWRNQNVDTHRTIIIKSFQQIWNGEAE